MKFMKSISVIVFVVLIVLLGYKFFLKKTSKETSEAKLYVVNVLDKNLYDDCHIKGSVNIPFDKIQEYAQNLNKKDHFVFYCSNYMCTASGASAKMFKDMGFENVWAYEAGMAEWFKSGLPIEGTCSQSYLKLDVAKSEHEDKNISVITTEELKEKMSKMTLRR